MARMLGRVESPGCCPGSRAGWYRKRRAYGPDCSGANTNTRTAKRAEQRQIAREIALLLEALAHLDKTLTPPWREASSL